MFNGDTSGHMKMFCGGLVLVSGVLILTATGIVGIYPLFVVGCVAMIGAMMWMMMSMRGGSGSAKDR